MTKPTISTQILAISTAQKVIQDLPNGVYAVNREYVQLSESYFLDLFQDKPFEIVDRKRDKEYPFEYTIHQFGTRFMTISNNGNPTRKHPVEELVHELAMQWNNLEHRITSAVFYIDGVYKIQAFKEVETDDLPVYTYDQLLSDESVTLEQAILDHMESVHNG